MPLRMLFVISSPRSGSTMLERMLESHSMIAGGPEPHLLTPLAHLGVWDRVETAPYDPEMVSGKLKAFVSSLPKTEDDYWSACRAYCDAIYSKAMEGSSKTVCLDKTPAYALILPFMAAVFPDAKYVVLTRHPLATFSSYANSFFDGDYEIAHAYNPLLLRYVPALADFLRQDKASFIHVRYEDLVRDPEAWMAKIYEYIGVPFEADTIDYGGGEGGAKREGLGDPLGVQQHSRPTTASLSKWVQELASDAQKRIFMEGVIDKLDAADLTLLGYPAEELWEPLDKARDVTITAEKPKLNRYRIQRKLIVRFREQAKRPGLLRSTLRGVQGICEGLLRD